MVISVLDRNCLRLYVAAKALGNVGMKHVLHSMCTRWSRNVSHRVHVKASKFWLIF